MSNTLIKGDPAAELQRLRATNFFIDKPDTQSESSYIYEVACRQAKRFGVYDYLADHYARLAAQVRLMERRDA